MRASEAVARIPQQVLSAFMGRLPQSLQDRVSILQNPTDELREELADARAHGKGWSEVPLFAQNVRARRFAAPAARNGKSRLEENYFYGSRRFPGLATNVIGAGALAQGQYTFFNKGLADDGASLGWPAGFVLGKPETNMELSGGAIPLGSNFVLTSLGISFNSDIKTADLAVMIDLVTLDFAKAGGQFNLSQGPLKMWPSGMGISGFGSICATDGGANTLQAVTNGSADIRAVRTLKIPRVLRAQEAFSYSMNVARATKSTNGTAIALSDFVVATIWLFGGQRNAIVA